MQRLKTSCRRLSNFLSESPGQHPFILCGTIRSRVSLGFFARFGGFCIRIVAVDLLQTLLKIFAPFRSIRHIVFRLGQIVVINHQP